MRARAAIRQAATCDGALRLRAMGYAVDDPVGYIVGGYTCGYRVRFYEDIPYAFSPRSLATALKGKRGLSGQELEFEEEHVARKADAPTTTCKCLTCLTTIFSRTTRSAPLPPAPPRRHRRCVERVWGSA